LVFLLGGCATLEVARDVQSGRRAMQFGNSQAALGHFEAAAQTNPDYITDFTLLDIGIWSYVGMAQYEEGEKAKALASFQQAKERHRDDQFARVFLGLVMSEGGDREAGKKELVDGLNGLDRWLDTTRHGTPEGELWDPGDYLAKEIGQTLKLLQAEKVFEESGVNGDGKKKGVFSRMIGAINPFSSSSDEKKDADKQSENGTDIAKLKQNGAGKATKPTASATHGAGGLTSEIDAYLKEKGIDAGDNNVAARPPTPDLPQITAEPAPPPTSAKAKAAKASTKEVLGKVDVGLEKEGKSVIEVPEPPRLIVKRRSKTDKGKKTRTSLSSSGMLGAIDKKLMKKGIELPSEEASKPEGLEASQPPSLQASRPQGSKPIELSPRLSRETTPFLINPGEFPLEEKPATAEKAKDPQSVEAARSANPEGIVPVFELPAFVTETHTATLPEKKEKTTENKTADGAPQGESAKDAFGQIVDELGNVGRIMAPLLGQ